MGDAAAETSLKVQVLRQFQWQTRRQLRGGEFAVKTFAIQQEDDGVLEIGFAPMGGHPWKLNALMINRVP